MSKILDARVNTAGAYVCIDGFYLFVIGIQPYNGHIPIVRLGGHREGQETGWQCAVREVYEESSLRIRPLASRVTYLADGDHLEEELQEIEWPHKIAREPAPLLVVAYQSETGTSLSLMYRAHTEGLTRPASEVKGILLLKKEEIHSLCQEPMTLAQYLSRGGRALLNGEFNEQLLLEPFAQLRLLSKILNIQKKGSYEAEDHI